MFPQGSTSFLGCKQSVNVPSVAFSTQVCYSVEKDVICMDAKMFGAFLAQVRRAQGLTQAKLAEQLHVTDKAVSRWERGVSHS